MKPQNPVEHGILVRSIAQEMNDDVSIVVRIMQSYDMHYYNRSLHYEECALCLWHWKILKAASNYSKRKVHNCTVGSGNHLQQFQVSSNYWRSFASGHPVLGKQKDMSTQTRRQVKLVEPKTEQITK